MAVETRISMCKICPAYCPIEVTIDEGRAVKVVGDRQSPLYGGYTCPKGRALPEAHNDANRLLFSQKRMPDGTYASIPTEQAIREIADKLKVIVAEHGPRAVGVFPGNGGVSNPLSPYAGAYFVQALGGGMDRFFSVQTIDQPGKVMAQALHGLWNAGPQPFHTSDTWILVGTNPVISKMGLNQNPGQVIKQAVKNGMKLIVIDPRRTESAHHAFLHLQPQPGQDPTLLAGFLHVILDEQLYDADFVRDNARGLEALQRSVAAYTPAYVAGVTGLPAEQILLAARTFANAKSGCIVTGTGPHFALHGTLLEYLTLCINTVCGRWVRAGQQSGHPHVLLPAVVQRAQPMRAYKPWDDDKRSGVKHLPATSLGGATGQLANEILTPGPDQVRALFCSGSNPMVSLPDQLRTSKALHSLELLVSLDVEMSNTARIAHYVIPDRQGLETPAYTQFTESMKYYGLWTQGFERPYAMYAPAVVQPPTASDVIEIWQFFYELAKHLGLQLTFHANVAGAGEQWDQYPVPIVLDMVNRPTTEQMFEWMCTGSRVSLSEVKQHPHGKIYDDLDHTVQPRDPTCDAYMELADPYMLAELQVVFDKRGDTPQPSEAYPLLMTPRRMNNVMNSIGRMNPKLGGRKPYNPAFLNPQDLEKYGLKSGDVVSVRSQHGEIVSVVEAEARLRPGTLSMAHCFGPNPDEGDAPLTQGSCSSRLMSTEDFDPITGQPRMGAIPVSISALHQNSALH
jgi:anaerobic selenocysteine-containing dehydrogenase